MSIRKKILGGFLVVALLGMFLGATGFVSAQLLSSKTTELHEYSIQSDIFTEILNAHYSWRNGLAEAVITDAKFKGALDPNTCALGQWLNSEAAKNVTDPELIKLLSRVSAPHDYIHHEAENILKLINSGNKDAAMDELMSKVFPKFNEVITELIAMGDRYSELVEERVVDISNIANTARLIIVVLITVALAGSIFFALFISSMVSKPLSPITKFMQRAGTTGDLTFRLEDVESINKFSQNKDELGRLIAAAASFVGRITDVSAILEKIADGDLTTELPLLSDKDTMGKALKKMTTGLNSMFSEINASSIQVYTGSNQVADGAQHLASGAAEQAASIEELSSSINEISERTKTNLSKAEHAAQLADMIKLHAEKGNHTMEEMVAAVTQIHEASQSIGRVIKTIDDIAFQTNILALNAAVEAARAGQHGKGFAIVANEVRNLAAKSAEAAKETKFLIDDSIGKAEVGVCITEETSASLSEIVSGINESASLVAEIARLSEEQSLSISQINTSVDQVTQVVQQNSAAAEQSAAASEEMSGHSELLRKLISQFRIKATNSAPRVLSLPEKSKRKLSAMKAETCFVLSDSYRDYGKY